MKKSFVKVFSQEWVEAWNDHDLNKILSHYTDDFEMNSPIIQKLANEPSGQIKGKKAVKEYWLKVLKLNPNLNFKLITVFVGVESIIIHYQGHRGLSAEIFYFNINGKVTKFYAHYA